MSSNKIINQVSNNTDQLNRMYPIGSIYISVNSTNPSNFLDGQWEQLKDKFLLACGDSYAAGSTGGEATHQLTIDEIPSHNHNYASPRWAWAEPSDGDDIICAQSGTSRRFERASSYIGGSGSHNNMPPYLSVYVWKRIS